MFTKKKLIEIASDRNIVVHKNVRKKDIETMINLLKSLGSQIKFDNKELIINNFKQNKKFASYNLVKTMRAGILVLGPLLAKFGNAKVMIVTHRIFLPSDVTSYLQHLYHCVEIVVLIFSSP